MDIDRDRLDELAKSLTEDQRQLLREGLAGGGDLDPDTLAESLRSFDTEAMFERLGADTSPLDASPLKFKKKRGPRAEDPVILKLGEAPATLSDLAVSVRERTGHNLNRITEVRVLDLDESEVDDVTLKRLATDELTGKTAEGRRLVTMERPSMATSIDDLDLFQQSTTGVAASARRVIVVVIINDVVIVVVFPPPNPAPPTEPPLTRW